MAFFLGDIHFQHLGDIVDAAGLFMENFKNIKSRVLCMTCGHCSSVNAFSIKQVLTSGSR